MTNGIPITISYADIPQISEKLARQHILTLIRSKLEDTNKDVMVKLFLSIRPELANNLEDAILWFVY